MTVPAAAPDRHPFSRPDALTQLADLACGPGRRLEVRLFSGGSVAFHPKAYIFWSSAGETAAGYVGSSNLSASGIDGGVEWNLGTDRVEQLVAGCRPAGVRSLLIGCPTRIDVVAAGSLR